MERLTAGDKVRLVIPRTLATDHNWDKWLSRLQVGKDYIVRAAYKEDSSIFHYIDIMGVSGFFPAFCFVKL